MMLKISNMYYFLLTAVSHTYHLISRTLMLVANSSSRALKRLFVQAYL